MQKSRYLFLVAALILGVAAFAPAPAQAVDWCMLCDLNPDCFSCCKCDGGSTGECGAACGSLDATPQLVPTLNLEAKVACTPVEAAVSEEAAKPAEAPSVEKAPASDETK